MKESFGEIKKRISKIMRRLAKAYPDAQCALDFSNPLELLFATILSAQCTDKRVNRVTPALFSRYKTAADYAAADPEEMEEIIRTTGFYKNKGKNIRAAAKIIAEKFNGKVPDRQEDLVELPGVGRKTANVVLGSAYGVPGLTVDTHMIRLNNRLRLTKNQDPVKIEFDLMKLVPRQLWTHYSHWIIHHGRQRCYARNPDCEHCEVQDLCPSAFQFPGKKKAPGRRFFPSPAH